MRNSCVILGLITVALSAVPARGDDGCKFWRWLGLGWGDGYQCRDCISGYGFCEDFAPIPVINDRMAPLYNQVNHGIAVPEWRMPGCYVLPRQQMAAGTSPVAVGPQQVYPFAVR